MRDISTEILAQASKGDIEAFKKIYAAFSEFIYNTAFKFTGSREDAQEITQDVFFRAYKSIKEFRAESKVSTWLYRICVNLCLNYQRKKNINKWLSLDFLMENRPDEIPRSSGDDPLEKMGETEIEEIVRGAVNSLPENQRVAVILSRYENLSYGEIAEVMKCSVSSVESYLFRAKQNLYKKLLPVIKM